VYVFVCVCVSVCRLTVGGLVEPPAPGSPDLEIQHLSGTRYCYDTVTDCAGQTMTTAQGADYARSRPPPPPPIDMAALTRAASVVQDNADPDDPTAVDATLQTSTSGSLSIVTMIQDNSDPDEHTAASASVGSSGKRTVTFTQDNPDPDGPTDAPPLIIQDSSDPDGPTEADAAATMQHEAASADCSHVCVCSCVC
jgi:hypothetical protein